MGYVGNEPDANYTSFAQQTITGNGGTSYTLSHAVASGKEILLYINNVKQEEGSGKAYEATGTALTLSEAITSSDSCYCVFLGKALQTTVPPDGSVTSAKLDTNIQADTLYNKTGDNDSGLDLSTNDAVKTKIAGSEKLKTDANSHLTTTTAGTSNFVLGVNAGNSIASGGNYNVALGDEAGTAITTGDENVCIGYQAGDALTDAGFNIAIGTDALTADTQGSRSVAIGRRTLHAQNFTSSTDTYNTAVGFEAGNDITTGTFNTMIGGLTGNGCTTGEKNTFIGGKAGGDSTQTGASNTCIGWEAGFNLTSGGNNLLLGKQAGRSTSPSGTINSGSSNVCLGDDNITALFCADTSISSSDSRDKADITDFNIGLNWVKDLRPVTYKWDKRSWYGTEEDPLGTPDGSKKQSKVHIGFLAQEVLEIEKANGFGNSADTMLTCNITEDEQRYGMKYERLVPILVNAIKELSAKNDSLEARITALEGK